MKRPVPPARVVDPGRLVRALALSVERLEPGVFRVTGGAEPHRVVARSTRWDCDCADRLVHPDVFCKHELAAKLYVHLERPILVALREAVTVAR